MYMHKSRVNATYSVGLDAFLVKFTFLSPVTPSVTSFGSKLDVGKYLKKMCCQKEETEERNQSETKACPARSAG